METEISLSLIKNKDHGTIITFHKVYFIIIFAGDTKCNSGSTGCVSGYAVRSSDGKCYECPERCSQCTDTGSSTECDYNYCAAGSAYKATDKTCPECPSDCEVCFQVYLSIFKCF